MHAKVSIIIPLYNSERTIKTAVESCLHQTYSNIEIIVIDDGSTDNSKQEIEEYIKQRKIKCFFQTNQERSAARNYGLDMATGDYINFLDSDDLLHSTKIEKEVRLLERNESLFAIYSAVRIFNDKTGQEIAIQGKKFKGGSIVNDLASLNFVTIQSMLFRKNKIRFNESMNRGEDWDFYLNMLCGKKVHYLDEVLSSVRKDKHLTRSYLKDVRHHQKIMLLRYLRDARFKSRRIRVLMTLIKVQVKCFVFK